jgi:uncharacterized protein (DUF1697 family)
MTHEAGTVHVALLRGINVGGHNKVPMAQLRRTVESTGATNVATYIQSGNVVLTSHLTPQQLRAALERAITEQLGVNPTVMVRTADELAAVVEQTPFPEAADNTVHVAFLHEPPDDATTERLNAIETGDEMLAVRGREIYLYLPGGLGRSKLADEMGKQLKQPTTMRNWRTVNKLLEMTSA